MNSSIIKYTKKIIPDKFIPKIRSLRKKARYFGFKYRCPFCQSHLKTFLPFGQKLPVLKEKQIVGGGYRTQAICPICGYIDRARLLILFLQHKTDIFSKPQKLLHVAPETGLSKIFQAQPGLDYLTADYYAKNVMVKMDITDIQYSDNAFDAIICNHVLEHVIEDRKAMSELYRTLKPGGWAILQVPFSPLLSETYEDFSIVSKADRKRFFGQEDHVRIYAMDYVNRLEEAGFDVNVFDWTKEPENFGSEKNKFGLNPNERVFFVQKSNKNL